MERCSGKANKLPDGNLPQSLTVEGTPAENKKKSTCHQHVAIHCRYNNHPTTSKVMGKRVAPFMDSPCRVIGQLSQQFTHHSLTSVEPLLPLLHVPLHPAVAEPGNLPGRSSGKWASETDHH